MTAATAAPTRPPVSAALVPLLALAVFINYIDRGNLATAAPLIKDELHLSGTQIGILTSAFFWTYTPSQLLAGWLAERINAYRTLALGLALWALATFMTGFSTGFAMILALRLVLGVGESAIFPCSSKLIAQHVHRDRLGATNALMSQGLALGPAFGVFFGGLMMAQFGWRNVFLLFGALSLLWLVPWIRATRTLSAAADLPGETREPSFRDILSRRELWGAALGHLTSNYGFYFVISWLPLYLVKSRGYSVPEMATISGLVYLTFAGAAMLTGIVTDRWVAAGATPNKARKTFFLIGHLFAALALLACPFAPTNALALSALFVAGAAMGIVNAHIYAAAQILAGPRAAGKWVGVQNFAGNISGIVGPIVTGVIIDRTGGYQDAFILAAAVTSVGIAAWVFIIPKIALIDWSK